MLQVKKGLPEEDELVLCKVTNIQYNSVFVKLQEYTNSGMIHISEISPGRIRNIRDYVKEGKVIVCKVLRINKERNQIDLSLRRVTEAQKKLKINEIKQAQISEKIIEFVANKLKMDVKKLYDEITSIAVKKHDNIYEFFEDIVISGLVLEKEGISKDVAKELEPVIKQRITIPEVNIEGKFILRSYESDGVEVIKEALLKGQDKNSDSVSIYYLGAGTYKFSIKAEEYKEAESILKNVTDSVSKHMEEHNSSCVFERVGKS